MSTTPASPVEFPLFCQRYLNGSAWIPGRDLRDTDQGQSAPRVAAVGQLGSSSVWSGVSVAKPKEGAQTELQQRREKFAYFDKQCSEVANGLFLGSDCVARDRGLLASCGITHVINCVGFICPAYFKHELDYLILFLQDTPGEDITSVMYDVFDYIEAALQSGGCVLVHCSQGVSRSPTLVIAYLMWKLQRPYCDVYPAVKAIRGITNPNIGFTCQLLNWHKRCCGVPSKVCRIHCIAPQCPSAPLYLVPRCISPATAEALDPRGAFLVQLPGHLYIWKGSRCPEPFLAAAERVAGQLHCYEGAPAVTAVVLEGQEPPDLQAALSTVPSPPQKARTPPLSQRQQLPVAWRGVALKNTSGANTGTHGNVHVSRQHSPQKPPAILMKATSPQRLCASPVLNEAKSGALPAGQRQRQSPAQDAQAVKENQRYDADFRMYLEAAVQSRQ